MADSIPSESNGFGWDFNYIAFISYSRRDQKFAKWLHRELESFRFPVSVPDTAGKSKWPLRPVFLDSEELPASSDLSGSICDALGVSRSLIVICSPDAASSKWVNREIEEFQATYASRQIFLLLLRGDPLVASAANPTGAFPSAIAQLPNEPLWIDARKGADSRARTFSRIAAGLLGVSFDAIWNRQKRKQHRAMLAWTLAGAATALPLMLAAIALVKPISLSNCPLNSLIFKSPSYESTRFSVDRVGSKRYFDCNGREVSIDSIENITELSKYKKDCRGLLGNIVLGGTYYNEVNKESSYRYFVYYRIKGSPCCFWIETNRLQEKSLFKEIDISWHNSQNMLYLYELDEMTENSIIDIPKDGYIGPDFRMYGDISLRPNGCSIPLKRRILSFVESLI